MSICFFFPTSRSFWSGFSIHFLPLVLYTDIRNRYTFPLDLPFLRSHFAFSKLFLFFLIMARLWLLKHRTCACICALICIRRAFLNCQLSLFTVLWFASWRCHGARELKSFWVKLNKEYTQCTPAANGLQSIGQPRAYPPVKMRVLWSWTPSISYYIFCFDWSALLATVDITDIGSPNYLSHFSLANLRPKLTPTYPHIYRGDDLLWLRILMLTPHRGKNVLSFLCRQ